MRGRLIASVRWKTNAGYVNAQYRFVMKPTYDCTMHFANPDAPLPWQDIVQVVMSSTSDLAVTAAQSDATCPICLSPPSAPRITRCGHVYCYACILHYLTVAEEGTRPKGISTYRHSKRCPICWDDVHAKDLKAVHWLDARRNSAQFTHQYLAEKGKEGGEEPGVTTLRLVERPQSTTLALPRSAAWPRAARPEGVYCFQPDALEFARIVIATPEFLAASLERDIGEIEEEVVELQRYTPDELSVEFLHVAKQNLAEQVARVHAQLEGRALHRIQVARNAVAHAHDAQDAHEPPGSYFFYQAASGQNIFIHPLDVKVLLAHFGAYAHFPDTLRVVVQHAEEGTMDETLRRKCKYIAHLPMSSDVTFLEVDWAQTSARFADTQGAIEWKPFEGMLKQRWNRHKEKDARENRARAKAEKGAQRSQPPPEPSEFAYMPDATLSFRDSAMIGAEMHFPTHPGVEEDALGQSVPFPSIAPAPKLHSAQKTVWGTPAAPSTAADPARPDTRVMDDAWNALEQANDAPQTEQQPAPSARSQKRKPKLILTGGGRGMG